MDRPQTRALVVGGVLGLVLGALAGWIYYRSNVDVDTEGTEKLEAPTPAAAVKLGLGLLGVLRLIAD